MKKIVHRFPFLSRIALALLLGAGSILLSGLVYKVVPIHSFFPFVGEALLVLATWILYRTDRQNLSALGLNVSLKNGSYLLSGLVIGIAALLAATWLRTLYTGEVWHLSSSVDAVSLARSLYYVLPNVMVQELMFRGYLFTKAISRFGAVKANVLFAVLFALMHVADREVVTNPAKMIALGVCTAVGHLWFATALLRSKTIWFPIGLHWGNNWAVMHLAGLSDNRQSLFYLTHQKIYTTWPPFLVLLLIFNLFFLLLTWLTWKGRLPLASKWRKERLMSRILR